MWFKKTVEDVVSSLQKMHDDLDAIATESAKEQEYHEQKAVALGKEALRANTIRHKLEKLLS